MQLLQIIAYKSPIPPPHRCSFGLKPGDYTSRLITVTLRQCEEISLKWFNLCDKVEMSCDMLEVAK